MLRKLSLVAIAAASLGAAALAPTSASAWGGWHGGWHRMGRPAHRRSAAPPITAAATPMAAAMCGAWSRRPGDRSGGWSIAATEPAIRPIPKAPATAGAFFMRRWNQSASRCLRPLHMSALHAGNKFRSCDLTPASTRFNSSTHPRESDLETRHERPHWTTTPSRSIARPPVDLRRHRRTPAAIHAAREPALPIACGSCWTNCAAAISARPAPDRASARPAQFPATNRLRLPAAPVTRPHAAPSPTSPSASPGGS